MKKVLLIICITIFGSVVNAQGIFSLGPKVGYNSYKLSTDLDSIHASIKKSFQIGAFVRVGKKFYFQPEANYQVSESTLSQSIGAVVQSQDVTLKSIKVPALIGLKAESRTNE